MFLLMSYFGLGNVYWTFNLRAVFCLFETPRMFYPPKGSLLAASSRGPIVFTYVLFWVSKSLETFHFRAGIWPKKIPEKALFDGTDGTGWTDGWTVIKSVL